MYLIKNLSCRLSERIDLRNLIVRKFGVTLEQITKVETLRRSIDARKKNNLRYNFTLLAELNGKVPSSPDLTQYQTPAPYLLADVDLSDPHPFIIGAGPAGLFAALALVEKGYQPYIFERGEKVEDRTKSVHKFWTSGILNPESNVQFGEGGAGTFSDGKLTSRSSDFYTNNILTKMIEFGAPKNILFEALPHIGTDGLKSIVMNIRKYLEEKGCKFFWNHKLEDIEVTEGKISSVTIKDTTYNPEILVLALGNSARDTFRMLNEKITISAKPFAVGFRIEHRQEYINTEFYGDKANIGITGPANYRLTAKHAGKGIFSFCQCPGGEIIGASSEPGGVVTNGMSSSSRSGAYANSAIVTTVNESDFGTDPLAAMEFQQKIEQAAYNEEAPFAAPSQTALDYVKNKLSNRPARSTYHPAGYAANLNVLFSQPVNDALRTGLRHFEKFHPNFVKFGKLIGPETRTSSPIRMERDRETFLATGISNLYPLGEGSGFAGGIVSSATDGYKAMQKIKEKN